MRCAPSRLSDWRSSAHATPVGFSARPRYQTWEGYHTGPSSASSIGAPPRTGVPEERPRGTTRASSSAARLPKARLKRVRSSSRPAWDPIRWPRVRALRGVRVDLVAAERGEALGDAGVHEERVAHMHADARAEQPRADRPIARKGRGARCMSAEGRKVTGCHVAQVTHQVHHVVVPEQAVDGAAGCGRLRLDRLQQADDGLGVVAPVEQIAGLHEHGAGRCPPVVPGVREVGQLQRALQRLQIAVDVGNRHDGRGVRREALLHPELRAQAARHPKLAPATASRARPAGDKFGQSGEFNQVRTATSEAGKRVERTRVRASVLANVGRVDVPEDRSGHDQGRARPPARRGELHRRVHHRDQRGAQEHDAGHEAAGGAQARVPRDDGLRRVVGVVPLRRRHVLPQVPRQAHRLPRSAAVLPREHRRPTAHDQPLPPDVREQQPARGVPRDPRARQDRHARALPRPAHRGLQHALLVSLARAEEGCARPLPHAAAQPRDAAHGLPAAAREARRPRPRRRLVRRQRARRARRAQPQGLPRPRAAAVPCAHLERLQLDADQGLGKGYLRVRVKVREVIKVRKVHVRLTYHQSPCAYSVLTCDVLTTF
eukprot:scaffold102313_cov57-Phaeocystis_antarctica.AAC.1